MKIINVENLINKLTETLSSELEISKELCRLNKLCIDRQILLENILEELSIMNKKSIVKANE